jgi:hypothetical protein
MTLRLAWDTQGDPVSRKQTKKKKKRKRKRKKKEEGKRRRRRKKRRKKIKTTRYSITIFFHLTLIY